MVILGIFKKIAQNLSVYVRGAQELQNKPKNCTSLPYVEIRVYREGFSRGGCYANCLARKTNMEKVYPNFPYAIMFSEIL